MTDLPPAGWYADPEDPSQQRYWDGSAWTEHRTPAAPQTSPWGAEPGWSPYASDQGLSFPQRGPETSGAAIAALVMGILSIVACFGPITGIPAMIVGRRATRDIDRSAGRVNGRGLATAGFWTGLVGTVLGVLLVVFLVIALIAFSSDSTA
jgi:hypothetical protein